MRIALLLIAACGSAPPPVVTNHVVEEKQPPATEGVDVGVDMSAANRPKNSTAMETGTFTRTYDNVVATVETKDHVVVTLAGAVHEERRSEDPDSGGLTLSASERTDAAARTITFVVPQSVKLDLRAGQHLRGTIAVMTSQWSGSLAAELADDAGPVFQLDPSSTHFEPGEVVKNAPASEDYAERHYVAVTLPTTKTPVALDGWSRHHLGSADYEVYGFAEVAKPDAHVNDWHQAMHFAIVRQPK